MNARKVAILEGSLVLDPSEDVALLPSILGRMTMLVKKVEGFAAHLAYDGQAQEAMEIFKKGAPLTLAQMACLLRHALTYLERFPSTNSEYRKVWLAVSPLRELTTHLTAEAQFLDEVETPQQQKRARELAEAAAERDKANTASVAESMGTRSKRKPTK